jgi:hypothetical protein
VRKILFIFTLFVFITTVSPAAIADSTSKVLYETSTIVPERNFDEGKLAKAKENPDFNYDLSRKREEPSWLDKLMYKIIGFLLGVLFNPTGSVENIFFYLICILLIIGLIVLIMRMNSIGIFSRSNTQNKNGLDFSELTEDINSIDFDKMIEEAVKTGMYRRAVRLYYLKSLKQLSDKSQIVWEINKTNRDYLYELRNPSLRTAFEDITYVYEYVWYGNVEIDAEKFSKVKTTFNQFSSQAAAVK